MHFPLPARVLLGLVDRSLVEREALEGGPRRLQLAAVKQPIDPARYNSLTAEILLLLVWKLEVNLGAS